MDFLRFGLTIAVFGACSSLWLGCSPSPSALPAPRMQDEQQTTSRVRADPLHPLLVEWPAAERARLESRAERGVVAVRYDGQSLEVIGQCTTERAYSYVPNTLHRDRVVIESRDELGAQFPLSVASLGGKLAQHGKLVVDLAIVGSFTVDASELTVLDFHGDCERATHVVSGMGAGAFELRSGSGTSASGGVSAGGLGVDGTRQRQEDILSRAGDVGACSQGSREDEHPPSGCGAIIRLELAPLRRHNDSLPTVALVEPPATNEPLPTTNEPPPTTNEPPPTTGLTRREPSSPQPDPFAPTPEAPAANPGGDSVWAFIIPGSLLLVGITVGVIIAVTKDDEEPKRDPVPSGGLGNTTLSTGVSF